MLSFKSSAIANGLNKRASLECVHRTTCCFTRCGVRVISGLWQAITPADRENWFGEVNGIQVRTGRGPIV